MMFIIKLCTSELFLISSSCNNNINSEIFFSQIEALSKELEEVKNQLLAKEKIVCKYQSRLQELRSSVEVSYFINNLLNEF